MIHCIGRDGGEAQAFPVPCAITKPQQKKNTSLTGRTHTILHTNLCICGIATTFQPK